MGLERDRVFDTTEIDTLSSKTQTLMDTADTVISEIYSELCSLSQTLSSLPADVRDSGLKQQVDDLKGSIKTDEFKKYSANIKKRLKSLNTSMANGDKKYGTEIAGIALDLCTVVTQLEGLKNLVPAGADSGSYTAFKKQFDSCVGSWKVLKDKMGDIKQLLIEAMLGSENDGAENSKDPVNLSTGNFIYEKEDMQTAGKPVLSLKRFYNALDDTEGVLGKGWRHSYEVRLEIKPEKADVYLPDGKKLSFQEKKNQTYYSDATRLRLFRHEKEFSLLKPEGDRFVFDLEGNIRMYEDERGERISFTLEDGKLTKALRQRDQAYYLFFYHENGRLSEVRDQAGRTVAYEYGEDGKLLKASRLGGGTFTYLYDGNGYIKSVVSADETAIVSNEFDKEGRCTRQHFADGSSMSFSYEDKDSFVELTERNGSRIRYYHDQYYHNVRTAYEDGEERFIYNRKGQCTYHKNQNGAVTRYAYDAKGNVTQVVDALGNKTNATYDARNHLISLKRNGKTKIHNEYNAKGELIQTTSADGGKMVLTYDENGNPSRLVLPDGGRIGLSFDERGNLSDIEDAFGSRNHYEYDTLNRVSAVTDGNGHTTRYGYNQAGDITSVTDPAGNSRNYVYNERGRITKITDFDGFHIYAAYNALNKLEQLTDKEGNEACFSYDCMWNLASRTAPDGGKTAFVYNRANRLERVELPNEGSIAYEYDAAGNRTAETDAEENRTSYAYDAMNRVTETTAPDSTKTAYCYDEDGNVAEITDALGNVRVFAYDEAGRRTAETDPLGNTTRYSYTPLGDIREILYPNGSKTVYEYEPGGRLIRVTQPSGASVAYEYDRNGNVLSETNNLGQALVYEYDCLNRMTSATSPNGGIKRYTYDAVGNVTGITDENGNQTEYSYSPNGNLICVKDALGNETKYEYDSMGRLAKIDRTGDAGVDAISEQPVMPAHQVTAYQWNTSGLIDCVTNPLGIAESYRYDKNGNVIEKTDGDGYKTRYTYNQNSNLTSILYADGKKVSYSYNALRQLEEIKDWLGTTKLLLDALGRPLEVTDFRGKTVAYEWGSMGEKTRLVYPDGNEAVYTYNDALQLTRLNGTGKDIAYEYDPLGRLKTKLLPNGISTEYQYNSIGRLESLIHKGKDGILESYRYTYDLAGNKLQTKRERTDLPEDSGIYGYEYDVLNRLTGVAKNGELLRGYRYDAFGNRTRKTDYHSGMQNSTVYHYNEGGQLVAVADGETEKTYQYDRRGNLGRVMSGGQLLEQFVFNTANQMERAETFMGELEKQAEYGYNGLGKRVLQKISSTENREKLNPMKQIEYTLDLTRQYYDLLSYEDKLASKKQDFIWDSNAAGILEEGTDSYYLQDDLGSVMNLTDGDGGSRELFGYDEFGLPVVHRSAEHSVQGTEELGLTAEPQKFAGMAQPFAFTGYQPDETTGLYYAQARRYDAGAGRFVSEDKIKGFAVAPFTLNPYGYCWNRPEDYVDLDGLWPKWVETVGKIVTVTATIVAVGAVVVGTGGAVVAAGVLTAGTVGGFANEKAEGSYLNGFAGGAVTGGIQTVLSAFGPIGNAAGGCLGSGIGTAITEGLDNLDPTVTKKHADIAGDCLSSMIKGLIWGIVTGGVQGITDYNNAMLKTDSTWSSFSGYTATMGNVLNTFYGAVTAALANCSSFENETKDCPMN